MNDSPRSIHGAWHAAAIALAFAAAMAWTWGTWPDSIVDFGRELYVPWRMSEGEALHRDLAWFNGPLSPHWNARIFAWFGTGVWTLVWVNAAIFAGSLALLHFVLRRATSAAAATFACLIVIATCGFGQQVGIGNYNQLAPYSHEATHGLFLGLASLALLVAWGGRGSILLVLASGFATGLAFLTKPETFVAAVVGASALLALTSWTARFRVLRAFVAFALGGVTAVLLAWSLQIPALGSDLAWRSTLGAWPQLFESSVSELAFYRSGMGVDAPLENLGRLALWAGGGATLAALAIALGTWIARRTSERAGGGAAALFVALALGAAWTSLPWSQVARPWPFFALLALVAATRATVLHRGVARWPILAGFAAFGLAFLAKMVLNARLVQYGFTLALPSTALLCALAWHTLPQSLASRGVPAAVVRGTLIVLLFSVAASSVAATWRYHSRKEVELASGIDAIRADVRGAVLNATLEWLGRQTTPSGAAPTVVALPEGVMVNYLARLRNPTPYVNFMPPELLFYGEESILRAFDASPPDIVLLTHKNTSEYGLPWFGRDYGQNLMRWVMENYRAVALFGDPPLGLTLPGEAPLQRAPVFGIRAFVRKSP